MPNFLCTTCGTQHAESDHPPAACAICQGERQYVQATGQHWTDLDRLRLTHRDSLKFKGPGLLGVGVGPHFAISQRALFLRTPKANVLWDCLPLLDEAVVEAIKGLGGISAVAISHPHYYSGMVEWGRAFGGVPIYLHAAGRFERSWSRSGPRWCRTPSTWCSNWRRWQCPARSSRPSWSESADCGWCVPRGEAGGDEQNGLLVIAVRSGCAGGVKFGG
jgi:hypothetical protein